MNRLRVPLLIPLCSFLMAIATPAQSSNSAVWGHLENGASYVILPNHSAPMIGCSAIIRRGSATEDWSTQGASHFLEHLLFNGTDKITQEELYAGMDRLGAYSNATTRKNHVNFMILTGTDEFWPAFDLQRQMLFESTLPTDKLEKERGIILEELAKDRSQSAFDLERILDLDLFGTSGYGLPTLGSETSIRSLTREQIQAFYENYYVPNEMTFLLVGDLDPVAAIDSLEATIGRIPARPVEETSLPDFEFGARVRQHRADVDGVHVLVTWQAPAVSHAHYDASVAFFDLLVANDNSPFAEALRGEIPWKTYRARQGALPGRSSYISLKLTLPMGVDLPALERALTVAGTALGESLLADEDVEAWKIQEETAEVFLREKPHYYGIFRGDDLINRGLSGFVHRLDSIESVSAEAVREQRTLLTKEPFRISWIEPLEDAAEEKDTPVDDATGSGAAPLDSKIEIWTLSNGARVAAKSGPESPVFAVHAFVDARSAREPEGQAGAAELVHRLLGKGTSHREGEEVEAGLRSLGVEWKAADSPAIPYDDHYSVPDFSFFRFQTLDRFAEPGLEILADILDTPRFTKEEFESERRSLLSRVAKDGKTSRGRARRQLATEVGSASSDLYGTSTSLEAMDFAGIESFSEAYLDPASMLFVIGSGWPIDRLRTLTETTLGQIEPVATPIEKSASSIPSGCPWPIDEAEPNEVFGDLPPLPLWIDDQGDEQSHIILAKWIEAPEEAGPTLRLMNSIVSEAIAFQLREREGLAYSIGSSVQPLGAGRWLWMASAGTRPENLPRLLEGLRELPDTAFTELPAEETLDTRRTKMKGRSLMRRVTRMNWAYHAGLALRRDQDAENLDARYDAMEELTPNDVASAYEQYLRGAPAAVFIAK